MTKIFLLEDSESRIDWFKQTFGDDNVVYSKNPEESLEYLKNSHFDIIFLDHDLGGAYTPGEYGDGIDLAKKMVEEEIHINTPIIVHSLNPVGAENIAKTLQKTHSDVRIIDYLKLRYQLKGNVNGDHPAR